jgi:excisionase family DNA binding protein
LATKQDIADLKAFIDERLNALESAAGGQSPPSKFMTMTQCAAHIGRTHKSVEHMVRKAQIPHIKIGRRVQFDREKIDRWIERHGRRGAWFGAPRRPPQSGDRRNCLFA